MLGSVALVPIIVPILTASPPIITTHGFVAISLYVNPLWNIALAESPMIPIPSPVCINVSFKYSRSNGGIPPSSLVSRLRTKFEIKTVPPTAAAATTSLGPSVLPEAAGAVAYALDCRNAFRAFESAFASLADREVKKLAAGRLWWKARAGIDLKAVLEKAPMVDVSREGCRIVKTIFRFAVDFW